MSTRKSANLSATALAVCCLMTGTAHAEEAADGFVAALTGGTTKLDLRLRYEHVEQDNALDEADALTLRTRLGYSTRAWNALSAFVEMEYVSALVDDYSLPPPPPPTYSVVADPEGGELNQYGLRYEGVPGLVATVGRSKLILDNARWVGNVGWRQNEQTFDGAFLKYTGIKTLTGQYAYLANVNTITATNVDLDGQLLNMSWAVLPQLSLTGYAYLLDYEPAAATDFDTYGLRAAGSAPLTDAVKLIYTAEFAQQSAETPTDDFDADYLLGELGVGLKPVTILLGYELLGSDDGAFALQTPLATKHIFQGWADVFLTTPAAGVQDLYLSVTGNAGPVALAAVYHEYSADESTPTLDDYGSEVNLSAGMKLVGKLGGLIKYASYSAEEGSGTVDTDKYWLQFDYAF